MSEVYPIHFSQNAFIYGELAMRGCWSLTFEFDLPDNEAVRDDERVIAALNQLLDRHEALRYTFVRDPNQTMAEHPDFHWHGYHQMATTRQLPPRGLARHDSPADFPEMTRFRLNKPPYLRLHLADGANGQRRARLDTHHVVADMWTYRILKRELGGMLGDNGAALPPAPVPYGQFAESEYQAFSSGQWEPSLEWWCNLLEDPPDHAWPSPTGETGRASWVTSISGAPYATLRNQLAKLRCTPFMILACAYAQAMGRAYDWDRLTLFVLFVNRRSATLNTVGQFSNIVYLPITLPPSAPLGELVHDVGRLLREIVARHGHVWMKYVIDRLPTTPAARLTGAPTLAIREVIAPDGRRRGGHFGGAVVDEAEAGLPIEGSALTIAPKPAMAGQHGLDADIILDFVHTTDDGLDLMLTYDRSRVRDEDARRVLAKTSVAVTTDGR